MSEDTWERAEWQESCVSDSVTSVPHSPTHLRWWIHREAMRAHRLVPFSVLSSCCNKPFPLCDKQDKRNQGIVQRRICCEFVILSWFEEGATEKKGRRPENAEANGNAAPQTSELFKEIGAFSFTSLFSIVLFFASAGSCKTGTCAPCRTISLRQLLDGTW